MTDRNERFSGGSAAGEQSLREVRAERLLSMRELAKHASVAPSTIYLIEAGRSTPHPAVARRIAGALDVDPQGISEIRRMIRQRGGLR